MLPLSLIVRSAATTSVGIANAGEGGKLKSQSSTLVAVATTTVNCDRTKQRCREQSGGNERQSQHAQAEESARSHERVGGIAQRAREESAGGVEKARAHPVGQHSDGEQHRVETERDPEH